MGYTAFQGLRKVGAGTPKELSLFLKDAAQGDVLVFDDATGRQVEPGLHGSPAPIAQSGTQAEEPRGRGRPRLGVIPREVTLLPRHWDWLNSQPGGASVALRKLVEEARRTSGGRDRVRAAQEAAYSFMSAIAGNLPGFEEAARALFAYDWRRFGNFIANWPEDVRNYAVKLAFSREAKLGLEVTPAHPFPIASVQTRSASSRIPVVWVTQI